MSKPRTKYATNRNHSSDNNPGLVEAIRNRTKEVQEQSEALRIAQEEEMGGIRQKNQVEKKYKRKYDLATPKPLGPRQKDGKILNASHGNPRGTGCKAKGIIIDDPPPQAEQPTHEESDPETSNEQEGDDREIEEEKGDEKGGGKEEIREVVQEQEVQQEDQGGDAKEKGKNKEGPKKKKGDHMPDPLKMFDLDPGDPSLGIPGDGGKDHKDARSSYEARNVSEYDKDMATGRNRNNRWRSSGSN
ncbi:high mobility group nucleosome-binding domain-containing protein 5-like [Papaver somniferum]|uniref:high mobility group nucleosome-binding domain-containing protein 5-like n=1 Tax=Papaver somniferum TaxID=3469 RepID=UPI000E6FF5D9|nr:high mobility group nucleosome-binding domain-containing protein 5-like [Papaver somniferum]